MGVYFAQSVLRPWLCGWRRGDQGGELGILLILYVGEDTRGHERAQVIHMRRRSCDLRPVTNRPLSSAYSLHFTSGI